MDNITHSLVGVWISQGSCEYIKGDKIVQRNLWAAALIGSNIADLDLFLTNLTPAPLGYLLHHRGFTHTLLALPLQVILITGILWLWCRWKSHVITTVQWCQISLVAFLGALLHLAMDALNVYGIHPASPWHNKWYYGDTLFIVEPWLWGALIPLMVITTTHKWVKWLLIALISLIPTLAYQAHWLHLYSLLSTYLIFFISLAIGYLTSPKTRLWLTGTLLISIVTAFYCCGQHAKYITSQVIKTTQSRLLSIAASPLPGNPLCWQLWSVEMQWDTYISRYLILSLLPKYFPVNLCPSQFSNLKLNLIPPIFSRDSQFLWLGQHQFSLNKLQTLSQTNCYFNYWLSFARIIHLQNGKANDLRFARREPNFTTLDLNNTYKGCPKNAPHWGPVRKDLGIYQIEK